MTIALLVMTDGRTDYLRRTIEAAATMLTYSGQLELWMHDDTGDAEHRAYLARELPAYRQIGRGPRRGFGGAIRHAWATLAAQSRAEYVFHLEQDFVFTRPVDLDAMAEILWEEPFLVQLALRRQPWNAEERAAGGIVEQHPDDYEERRRREHEWLEHRRFFTTNPSLYRRALCHRGWPDGAHSEGHFGVELFRNPLLVAGYWGARDSGEWVEHIGNERVGTGY